MKGIDHLVLCVRDLEAARRRYESMGFTMTPPARHPFGTGNSLVQMQGSFLEVLTVVDPGAIPEHGEDSFSFAAFNRDFLSRTGEGLSMLVLDSTDARADQARYRQAGLHTYAPFDFQRLARLPSGEDVTVGFSLAFVTHDEMPEAGFFVCQQRAPEHFWKPQYQVHENGAANVTDIALVAEEPARYGEFLSEFAASPGAIGGPGICVVTTARGRLSIMTPARFANRYGWPAPSLANGPRFAGYTVGVPDLGKVDELLADIENVRLVAGRLAVGPQDGFGAVIAFEAKP